MEEGEGGGRMLTSKYAGHVCAGCVHRYQQDDRTSLKEVSNLAARRSTLKEIFFNIRGIF